MNFNKPIKESVNSLISEEVGGVNTTTIVARDRDHLEDLIQNEIKENGNECDLNHIDVSSVTDMYEMFKDSKFNGDISNWNVSKVTDMSWMFRSSQFNGDISKWDVNKVTDMDYTFKDSQFNGDLSKWNVSNVRGRTGMFWESPLEDEYGTNGNNL